MESDYENKNWDPRGDTNTSSSLRRKKVTRNKLLQSANKKYADKSLQAGTGSRNSNKRYKHLGGISRGYLDTGTVTNTMRLYNKANESISNRRQRLKKIGNYQKKALNRLTGFNSKKKLRDLAMLISEDDGDIDDEDNNDMLDDDAKENSLEPYNDIDLTNDSTDKNEFFARENTSTNNSLINEGNLFVVSSNSQFLNGQLINESINQSNVGDELNRRDTEPIIPTLSNHSSNILPDSNMDFIGSNTYIKTSANSDNKNSKPTFEKEVGSNETKSIAFESTKDAQLATIHNKPASNRGIMSNDGEEDYDESEFGYDGDEDIDGDDTQGNSKKEMRRRKQLESDFDEQLFMAPGTHKIDHLISESLDGHEALRKLSNSPELNIGLNTGKRRRRSSNYQDINNKQNILQNFIPTTKQEDIIREESDSTKSSSIPSLNSNEYPENKKTKITNSNTEFAIEGSFVGSMNQNSKKVKRKHMKPPKLLIEPHYNKPLTIKDIRDLVIYCLDKTERNKPIWCKVENRMNIEKIVVLQIPGAQPKDLSYNGQNLKSFDELLNDKDKIMFTTESFFETDNTLTLSSKAPGNGSFVFSAFSAFTNVPLPKQKQQAIIKELSKKKPMIEDLLLKADDMIELQYPLHPDFFIGNNAMKQKVNEINMSLPDTSVWAQTASKGTMNYVPQVFSLDCEMCLTKAGHELTRVSIVNFKGQVVFDHLVVPDNPITDYLTKYSGITEEMMQKAHFRLADIQKFITTYVDSRDILIGHSLQSDLKALKIRHPKVIDTAVIYEHVKGPPFKPALRNLSSIYLGKEIQNNDAVGHDPCVDARTCLELVQLKLKKGLQTGLNLNSETIFKKLEDSSNVKSLVFNKYAPDEAITDLNEGSNMKVVSFKDDEDIIEKIIKNYDTCSLFVGKLSTLENTRYLAGKTSNTFSSMLDDNMDTLHKSESITDDHVDAIKEQQAIKSLKKTLRKLTESLSKNSMVILFSGSGDLRNYKKIISEINSIRMPEKRKSFSLLKKDELKQAVDIARDSVVTIYIKK